MRSGEILFLTLLLGTFVTFSVMVAYQVMEYERTRTWPKASEAPEAARHHAHA